ncbi:hypothetical protein [Sphingomonas endolithica]|uniref:hypothetical protein n=1 Tax=Sphingomonas endolithica TaxID=2972485 RepID=UPI0021AFEA21|nr:hypothetical protein [Sphingomonas sp. ZFBP2030]
MTAPTPDDLHDTLVKILVSAATAEETRWREAVGEVEKLSRAFNIKSNRAIHPAGVAGELAMMEQAVEIVRAEHPYVCTGQ